LSTIAPANGDAEYVSGETCGQHGHPSAASFQLDKGKETTSGIKKSGTPAMGGRFLKLVGYIEIKGE